MGTRFLRMGLVLVLFGVLSLMAPLAQAAPQAPPVNDDFANAIEINGDSGSIAGTTVAATKEAGEPNHAGNVGGKSIWYKWVAPGSGAFRFTTFNSSYDTLLAAYTGASVNALSEVASNDECGTGMAGCIVLHANGGTTYWIAIDGYGGGSGGTNLTWGVPPPNDDFANAAILDSLTGSVSGTLHNATKEPGEPYHAGSPGGWSAWYRWTAPQTTRVRFSVSATNFDPLLGIYTGNSVNALTKVLTGTACSNALAYASLCRVFDAAVGTTYYIAIDGQVDYWFDFSLNWSVPPSNDDFEDAQVLLGTSGTIEGSNVNATGQPGEPTHNEPPSVYTVWYKWTAPANGWIHFDTADGDSGPTVAIYTGSHLEELVTPTDLAICLGTARCAQFYGVGGTIYKVQIDSQNGTPFTLHWRPLVRPANDDLANAQVLSGNSTDINSTTLDATREPGEPEHHNLSGQSSVWYRWTAPISGRARLNPAANFSMVVAVYTGEVVNALTPVTSRYAYPFNFEMVKGTTYAIAVDGSFAGDNGPFTMRLNCPETTRPILGSPPKGTQLTERVVWLSWEDTDCASHYEVMVRQSSKTGPVVSENKDLDQSDYFTRKLKVGYKYFWRVKACSAFQCTASKWNWFMIKK